jgi:hypothetical protein
MLIITSMVLLVAYIIVDQLSHSKRLVFNVRFWLAVGTFVMLMTMIFRGIV